MKIEIRRTGKTTAAILKAISESIVNPGSHVLVNDEHMDMYRCRTNVRDCANGMITQLGLLGIRAVLGEHTVHIISKHRGSYIIDGEIIDVNPASIYLVGLVKSKIRQVEE